MDDHFIDKLYRSIVLAWVIAMVWALGLRQPWVALSITLGTALGTAVLATYHWTIRRAFVPGARKPGRALLKMGLVKYPVIGIILYMLVRWDRINILAFCGGIVLVHAAILLKLASIRLMERMPRADQDSCANAKESGTWSTK
jgi:hypothetical protein